MNKTISIIAGIVGVLFLILAFVYWTTPANALPSFFPGFDPAMAAVHFKHGLASFILGLGCFVLAWFSLGKKKAS